jgi:hypothetical protein
MKEQRVVAFKAFLYSKLPTRLQDAVTTVRLMPGYLQWQLNRSGRKQALKILGPLKNKFVGCRCVVIGNGPSLRKTNLSLLKNEYTFGLNRIYLLFEELGFETDLLLSMNRFQFQYYGKEMSNVTGLKVFNWKYRRYTSAKEKMAFLPPKLTPDFNGDILSGFTPNTGTVTNLALEVAYFMGFSEIILIGVDFSFLEQGTANTTTVLQGADQNHFTPNYYEPGVVWQLPDYAAQIRGFRAAKKLFDENGRKVVDATVAGKLDIFPKVDFEEYLSKSPHYNKVSSLLEV